MSTTTADIYEAPEADLGLEVPNEQSGIFGYKGRLSVLGYMARSAVLMVAMAVLGLVIFYLMGGMTAFGYSEFEPSETLYMVGGALLLAFIPLFWIGTLMLIKRLHDINRSGWWMLLTLVPLLGTLYLLYISLQPGKPEGNRFGHPVPTEGWEKPVGILGILLTVALLGSTFVMDINHYLNMF